VISTTTIIMMSYLLLEDPALRELVFFLRGVLPRDQLSQRKWIKPAARFDKIWKWIMRMSRCGKNRTQLIVTRSAVTLRI
jgi:hypothetical protein